MTNKDLRELIYRMIQTETEIHDLGLMRRDLDGCFKDDEPVYRNGFLSGGMSVRGTMREQRAI